MRKSLAIITPSIGVRSETFIRRHMESLLPGNTVTLASTNRPPNAGYWNTNNPTCLLDNFPPNPLELIRSSMGKVSGKRVCNKFILHRNYIIKSFLKKHRVNVLMGEYLDYTHAFIAPAKELGIPLWGHAHGYDISQKISEKYWQQRYLEYNQTEGIIAVNEITRRRLIKLGIKPEKIHIIPCGVNIPEHCPQHKNYKDNVRCLAVGRMVRKKAPIQLLSAFKYALRDNPKMHLDYIGTGHLIDEVKDFINHYQLSGHVTLHGGMPNAQVHEFMMASDIFIQHSVVDPITGDEEGLPVAILEAMAHGLPVISTRHAGIPDAVVHNQTGFLVDEGDVYGMGCCILDLVNDIDKRLGMGVESWQRAKNFFSWQYERREILKLFSLHDIS